MEKITLACGIVQLKIFWCNRELKGKEKGKLEAMSDDDWEELKMKAMSTIRLSLAPEVKYNVMNETSATVLWKKLEKLYMSKSLTNKLFLKKQLYQLRMEEGIWIISTCLTKLLLNY